MATVQEPRAGNRYETFVEAELSRARRRIHAQDVGVAALGFLAGTLAYALGMVVLDRWLDLSETVRQIGLFGYLTGAGAYAMFVLSRPFRREVNPYFAARQVELAVPGAKNSVISWLDLHAEPLPESIRAAVSQKAAADLKKADVDEVVRDSPADLDRRRRRRGVHRRVDPVLPVSAESVSFAVGPGVYAVWLGRDRQSNHVEPAPTGDRRRDRAGQYPGRFSRRSVGPGAGPGRGRRGPPAIPLQPGRPGLGGDAARTVAPRSARVRRPRAGRPRAERVRLPDRRRRRGDAGISRPGPVVAVDREVRGRLPLPPVFPVPRSDRRNAEHRGTPRHPGDPDRPDEPHRQSGRACVPAGPRGSGRTAADPGRVGPRSAGDSAVPVRPRRTMRNTRSHSSHPMASGTRTRSRTRSRS